MMDPFFMFLFTSFLMLIFLIFLSFWLPWKVNQRKNMPKFSFDTFKHFYMLNPEKWYLDEYSVNYKGKDIEIEFEKYRDVIKYYFFKKDLKKNKERRDEKELNVSSGISILLNIDFISREITKLEFFGITFL